VVSSITLLKALSRVAGARAYRARCEKMCPRARCAMCFIGRPPDVALGAWAGSPRGATPRRASPRKFCESCISVHALPRLVPTADRPRRPVPPLLLVCSFVTFGLKSGSRFPFALRVSMDRLSRHRLTSHVFLQSKCCHAARSVRTSYATQAIADHHRGPSRIITGDSVAKKAGTVKMSAARTARVRLRNRAP